MCRKWRFVGHAVLDYSKLMRAYGKKPGELLNKGWMGPHGTYGRWTLQGDWLGF
jgi:hypothetical protein